ncbi:hypothetical protein AJ88_30045 [Mesorhizobium amorphae CCBAU 01583]|nr:hypothetical protein AJ88_30045 [Mesorhizobium amorphae CCBAU 01583]
MRFHIHPDAELLQDEHDRLVLTGDQTDTWVFTCKEVVPEVEESIYFAGLAARAAAARSCWPSRPPRYRRFTGS